MRGPDRRQTPRTTMERHAYINIEPNNGGIVLNVSSDGLCFHSFDPVKRNGKVRFWFSDQDQRIDADAELAWTDETQKGGLRFTALPPEAREHIRNWMSQPAMQVRTDGAATPSVPSLRAFLRPRSGGLGAKSLPASVNDPVPVAVPESRVAPPLRGFSGGLVTGLLMAALVAAVFLFNSYRREFGESLIRLGERFAAKSVEQAQTASPVPPGEVPARQTSSAVPQRTAPASQLEALKPPAVTRAPQTVPPAQTASSPPLIAASTTKVITPTPAPKQVQMPEKIASPPPQNTPKPEPAKVEATRQGSVGPAMRAPISDPSSKVPAVATNPSSSSPSLPSSTAAVPMSNVASTRPAVVPPSTAATRPGVQAEDSGTNDANAISQMYFEIGKFKDQGQAHDTTFKLAQLGFPATAVQKGHLWSNSYHVLVGPYEDPDKANVTHQNLVSRGFKPRPFERGSRSMSFRSGLTLNGAQTPVGDYTISWESYVSNATVKFMRNDSVVTTADGRWVKRDAKYEHDAYVYRRNMDGSRTLLEIHFGGMKQALVFGKS